MVLLDPVLCKSAGLSVQHAENPLQSSPPTAAIKAGDIFKGNFQLQSNDSDSAEFIVYFTETNAKQHDVKAFEIEAVAMVATEGKNWIYGLSGVFDTEYRQLILYDIIKYIKNSTVTQAEGEGKQERFHPVGFAGQVSADHQTITCSIAFNGDASLTRIVHPEELEEKLLHQVKSNFL